MMNTASNGMLDGCRPKVFICMLDKAKEHVDSASSAWGWDLYGLKFRTVAVTATLVAKDEIAQTVSFDDGTGIMEVIIEGGDGKDSGAAILKTPLGTMGTLNASNLFRDGHTWHGDLVEWVPSQNKDQESFWILEVVDFWASTIRL